ncbi:FecR domain-containing protein [Alloalcanivorax sp. C16-2]|uniref:FecR domain-containing protein n=1 Tax=Alloalcanivorax sp. C16-2 TaxID=3390052 RepID=UPI003970EF9B
MSGMDIPEPALEQAARWFALLGGDHVTEQQKRRWLQWLDANVDHRRAWEKVEHVDQAFRAVPVKSADSILSAAERRRRRFLQGLGGALLLAPVAIPGWLAWQAGLGRSDLSTARGEIGEFTLPDGGRLWLNTDSAVAVRFDDRQRRLRLFRGELYLRTAHDPRPLWIDTPEGRVSPLGTAFGVRLADRRTWVSVDQGRVRVQARQGDADATLGPGEGTRLDGNGHLSPLPGALSNPGWRQGQLLADGRRLGDLLDELGRYRHGWLRYDPAVADLRLTGAFPLADTDRILDLLEASLPVTVTRVTPWWVTVTPRPH